MPSALAVANCNPKCRGAKLTDVTRRRASVKLALITQCLPRSSQILTSKSLPEIGREFSNRDHTTIIHSVKTIEKLKEKDPEMTNNINNLKNQILYNKENEI